MKKRIIIVLLIMVITLTMTACVNSDVDNVTTTPVESSMSDTTPVESIMSDTTYDTSAEPETKVEYLTKSKIQEMGPEELSAFYFEMINISETKKLSITDMDIIANNFYNIWHRNSAYEKNEFNLQCYNVFCNVYEQAINAQIPLEALSSWTSIPAPEMLCKYFSSSNFAIPEDASCYAIGFLEKEDIVSVAEAFLANPKLATNSHIPSLIILCDCNKSTTDMAWEHLEKLTKCISPETTLSSESFTSRVCMSLLACTMDSDTIRKVAEIAEYMLENPYYDIKTKYMYFCNAFYNFETGEYTDGTIGFKAIDSLFVLAKNADDDTREQLYDLGTFIAPDIAEELYSILEKN